MKSKEQLAVDFASDRDLGAGHGYPSFEATLLEKGFIAGYEAKQEEINNYIKRLEESKGFGFSSRSKYFFADQRQQMEYAKDVDEIIKHLKAL